MEINKVYKTKMGEGYLFQVTDIIYKIIKSKKGVITVTNEILSLMGYYIGDEHIGKCPMNLERLHNEETSFPDVCDYRLNRMIFKLKLRTEKLLIKNESLHLN